MAEKSALTSLLKKNRYELSDLQGKSQAWFTAQVRDLIRPSQKRPETLMRGDQNLKSNKLIPGQLTMFIYDPKHKETLPYYDIFPLIFPFKTEADSFLGINLHYLPYYIRASLLDRLMVFKTNGVMDVNTKLKFSWQTVANTSRFNAVKPCVKRYLYSHVQTPFKFVEAPDWPTAMLLPTEHFVKQSKETVWIDSLRTIKGK